MHGRAAAVLGRRIMAGPMEKLMEARLREALAPTELRIVNESHLHRGHQAMQGVASTETHFRVTVVSEAFRGKPLLARHRAVNALLGDQLKAEGGIHALALVTKTPEEAAKPSPAP
ncbi:BolA domain UV induced protein Uvi31 [Coemansia nantahalensis]|uniref:BolA domain UV induced protein Uvi31 n=2 Tax=Coemansia TaxID=4863 RepID=A0ACC1L3T6_9FUNG|nr:BolA domain UV induced protein Uvi31 [Coemansia nantahalensis]KAJ2799937.1 BolA domain UV induced protein Uvi31 [Coemansia helicoidea]